MSEPQVKLSQAVKGVFWHRDMSFEYCGIDGVSYEGNPHVLPIATHDGDVIGDLHVDGEVRRRPIGFRLSGENGSEKYMRLSGDLGSLVEVNRPKEGVLYLPVHRTEHRAYSERDAPRTFGLQIDNRPLTMVYKHRDEPNPIGIVEREGNRDVEIYRLDTRTRDGHDKIFRRFFANLLSGVFVRPDSGLISGASLTRHKPRELDWSDTQSIVSYLNGDIIGQRMAKETLAVAFSLYARRMEFPEMVNSGPWPNPRVLLVGPTGVGKTMLVETLAEKLEIPIRIVKATGKSASGFKGRNFLKSVFDDFEPRVIDDRQYAVIFVDEVDKLSARRGFSFAEEIQDEIVGLLAGKTYGEFDMSNILFVCAGAFHGSKDFPGLEKILKGMREGSSAVGFGARESQGEADFVLGSIDEMQEALRRYGLKQELVGRLDSPAFLHKLTEDQLVQILREGRQSVLKGYIRALSTSGVDLIVDDSAYRAIVNHLPQNSGARSLNATCKVLFGPMLMNPGEYKMRSGSPTTLTPNMVDEIISAQNRRRLGA